MKQSEIYRQNAENCAYLAENAPNEQPANGTSEWKQLGEHWRTNRTGLMARRRLHVKATAEKRHDLPAAIISARACNVRSL